MTASLHAVTWFAAVLLLLLSCIQAFCIAFVLPFLFVCFSWYHAHIFEHVFVNTFFSPTSLVWPYRYIYMYNVCNNACGCVHILLLRGNTFVWAFWPCSFLFFLPSSQAKSHFFASVLYICLYKYVQRIMCPLPLLFVRATFVKLKVAGTTCFFKKFCAPPPTQSGACCTWWKQDLVGLNVL